MNDRAGSMIRRVVDAYFTGRQLLSRTRTRAGHAKAGKICASLSILFAGVYKS